MKKFKMYLEMEVVAKQRDYYTVSANTLEEAIQMMKEESELNNFPKSGNIVFTRTEFPKHTVKLVDDSILPAGYMNGDKLF